MFVKIRQRSFVNDDRVLRFFKLPLWDRSRTVNFLNLLRQEMSDSLLFDSTSTSNFESPVKPIGDIIWLLFR